MKAGSESAFEELHFSPAPAISKPVPGPRSRQMLAEQEQLESSGLSYPREIPLALEEGRGATVRDVDGNTYVDFFAGAGVLNLGHNHPAVTAAAIAQQHKLVHALDFPTASRLKLMRTVKEVLPGSLRQTGRFHFGGPTGSDAVEASLKLVRNHTGREAVIAFSGSYHGMTAGAQSVTSSAGAGSASAPVHFVPFPYCYRCPLGQRPESCGLACAELLESAISDPHSGVPEPAGVIVEPIQGEAGTIVPPRGWLARVREITNRHGIPLVVDEIQTGFGRTGEMFACQWDAISPDVVLLSKAIGGGGHPLSAIAFDGALDGWPQGAHIGTFRGHQVAMAAGATAVEQIRELHLVDRSRALGAMALEMLEETTKCSRAVGEVRGRGLMIGVELVEDRDSRVPWPALANRIRRTCFEAGLLVEVGGHHANVIRFLPPLVISRDLLERGLEIFLDALRVETERPTASAQAGRRT